MQTASAVVTETLRFPAHHRLPGARRKGDSETEEKNNILSKEDGFTKKGKKMEGKWFKRWSGFFRLP